MFLWEVLLLPGERASVCGRRDNGGVVNPLAARRLAVAETQTPLGTHIQRGETGQVGVSLDPKGVFLVVSLDLKVRENPMTFLMLIKRK